jgi:hypothetical protein
MNDYSPKQIATTLFTQDAKDPCSFQILAYQDGSDITYIFEILCSILMEGLDLLTNDLSTVDLTNFNGQFITSLNPWFNSMGFNIHVDELDIHNINKYNEYYCKIIIRTLGTLPIFVSKQIKENYHFTSDIDHVNLNKNKTNIKDIYTVFFNENKVYKIWFDFYKGL